MLRLPVRDGVPLTDAVPEIDTDAELEGDPLDDADRDAERVTDADRDTDSVGLPLRVGVPLVLEVGDVDGVVVAATDELGVDVLVGRTVFPGRKLDDALPVGVTLGVTLTLDVGLLVAAVDPLRVGVPLPLTLRVGVPLWVDDTEGDDVEDGDADVLIEVVGVVEGVPVRV